MKIAFVNGTFPQLSQTFVVDQIDFAIERGHDVAVLATQRVPNIAHDKIVKTRLYDRLYAEKMPVLDKLPLLVRGMLKRPRSFGSALASRVAGRGKLPLGSFVLAGQLERAPDVLLVNFGTNLPAAVRLKKHIYPEARIACIFHGFDVSKYPLEHGWGMYEQVAPFVDLAITVNGWQADELRKRVPFRRVQTCHLGIDLARLPQRKPHGDKAFSLLFVGRAVEKKGLTYLIEAMDRLRDLNVRLHVVGGGPQLREDQIHAKVRGLSDRIVFYGAKGHDFVLELMAACDCLVAPSVTASDGDAEGIPVTLMEAMAVGIPVISTYHSGIPELITNMLEGRLVAERDSEGLARAVRGEITTPARFVEGAKTKVRSQFAMNTQYTRLFGMLEDMLAD